MRDADQCATPLELTTYLFHHFLDDTDSDEEAIEDLRNWGSLSPHLLRRLERGFEQYLAERPRDGSSLTLVEIHANVSLDEYTEDAAWAFIDEFAHAFRTVVHDLEAAGKLPRA
ncbi:hypothetical protein [Kineococcus sp. SYSU DK002]|uniref:hypothetical protein n=1 Tax=Kineococcus sp. SYSU DK002 TaxID=3383123 RepID=UPI003D7D8180